MIPRSTKGGSIAGALRYDLEKKDAQMLDSNCAGQNWQEIAKEMGTFAAASSSKKPVLHTSLSLPAGETMTHDEWRQAAQIYLKEMQLEGHQFVLTLHNDAKHQHCHLVINRVNEKGRLANDSNDRRRSLAACRIVEKEMSLKVIDKDYQKENAGRFDDVKKDLAVAIELSSSTAQLREYLKANGYNLILNESKTTGRISGASLQALSDNKIWKMSELKKGGWSSVEKSLNKNIEKESSSIRANASSHNNSDQHSSAGSTNTNSININTNSISSGLIESASKEEAEYLVYLKKKQQIKEQLER